MKTKYNLMVLILILVLPALTNGQVNYREALSASKDLDFYERIEFMIGNKIFEFEGTSFKGELLNSATIEGKVTVINFWFMSCPPCIAELKGLNEIVEKYEKEKDVEFISFTLDTKEILIEDFIPNYEFKFEIIPNSEPFIFEELAHPFGFPTTFVIDQEGIIRQLISGGSTEEEKATEEIKSLLIPTIETCLRKK